MASVTSRRCAAVWSETDAVSDDAGIPHAPSPRRHASARRIARPPPAWFLSFVSTATLLVMCWLPVLPSLPTAAVAAWPTDATSPITMETTSGRPSDAAAPLSSRPSDLADRSPGPCDSYLFGRADHYRPPAPHRPVHRPLPPLYRRPTHSAPPPAPTHHQPRLSPDAPGSPPYGNASCSYEAHCRLSPPTRRLRGPPALVLRTICPTPRLRRV
jgi:hypothetical protein